MLRTTLVAGVLAVSMVACAGDESGQPGHLREEGQNLAPEAEPNGAAATATPIVGTQAVLHGNLFPAADADYYSFSGTAGDHVYAATQTVFTQSGSGDTVLQLLGTDGTTILEADDENGSFNANASSIAGAVLPSTGTFYLRVAHFTALGQVRPYELHFQIQSGAPALELVEPNDTVGQRIGNFVQGTVASATDVNIYGVDLNAGDTLYASLDMDPERDGTTFNGTLGLGVYGGFFLLVNDNGAEAGGDSEATFITAKVAGSYFVRVANTAVGTGTTYQLSISVHPAASTAGCVTYTSTTPITISTVGTSFQTGTIDVPDDIIVGDIDVNIQLNHTFVPDLDIHLASPLQSDTGMFTDIGAAAVALVNMDVTLDDEAGIPVNSYNVFQGMISQPEATYRMSWFDGERAQGTWTLGVFDDVTGDGGAVTSWSITICPPPPPPTCPVGMVERTVFSTDFETDDAGFTHSGTADEWARGLPGAGSVPITTCNGGVNCFKTDLAGTYNASSSQDLLSPAISLAAVTPPIRVSWSQKLQMQNATNDHASVDVRNVGGSNPRRLFEWLDGTMTDAVGGAPFAATIPMSAGWGVHTADISSYVGTNVELLFHLDSDAATNLSGLAIDDVVVIGCEVACGNGAVNSGEECDDGNTVNGDGCDNNCTISACGNGIVAGAEECEDGNLVNGDGCDNNCTNSACGNNIVAGTEACDDGNLIDGDGCDSDCSVSGCGNGITAGGEECDDGDLISGDGCDANCTVTRCGNNIATGSEECDDGNATDGDGCDNNCTVTACGNNVVTGVEECDDGNAIDDDGCDSNCTNTACGNGIITSGEACDDGNLVDGDGCDSNCTDTACGNTIVTTGEVCDDGNTTGGDGCSANCLSDESCGNGILDPGEDCDDGGTTGADGCSAICGTEVCGNGIADPGEECDDGNTTGADGCSAICGIEICGNGIVNPGEVCDDGNTVGGDGCSANCLSAENCGNGIVDPGEACDDGNNTDGDGCNATCTSDESCGNGILDPGEVCDDGNTTDGDGCNAACTSNESCGNGFVNPGEACDDGNTTDGDGCNAACTSDESCGNGTINPGEVCDDGNTTGGDGCSTDCRSDESCGNGIVNPGEACDDGNATAGDGCEADCTVTIPPSCGDGTLDTGEVCDDGNNTGGDGCSADCQSDESCGNGLADPGEACDDGNTTAGDGCEPDCTVTGPGPSCGNSTLDTGEACDDGNTANGDGCSATCQIEGGDSGGCDCRAASSSGSNDALLLLFLVPAAAWFTRRRR